MANSNGQKKKLIITNIVQDLQIYSKIIGNVIFEYPVEMVTKSILKKFCTCFLHAC